MQYFQLIQQAWSNTFKKNEYHRWWGVPLRKRLAYGLISYILMLPIFIFMAMVTSGVVFWLFVIAFVILVVLPLEEYYAEKLKRKYADKEEK